MTTWGIVLAGGGGNRFGGLKQYAVLGGRTLLERVVDTVAEVTDGVVLVLPAGHGWTGRGGVRTATGGSVRAESVRNGLAAVPPGAELVLIADAAHPLASAALHQAVIDRLKVEDDADAAVPGLPLTDAVKTVRPDGSAGETIAAAGRFSAQMPMAFRTAALLAAHRGVAQAVEDSAMVTANGGRVVLVPGELTNVHVTTPQELALAELLLPAVPRRATRSDMR